MRGALTRHYQDAARTLRGGRGFLDLASIVVGVLVAGFVASSAAATVLVVVPWAQDRAAQQSLQSVVYAETTSFTLSEQYTDYHTLVADDWATQGTDVEVAVNAAGTCYAASVTSGTGTVYYATSESKTPSVVKPAALTDWTAGNPLYGSCEPTPSPADTPDLPADTVPDEPVLEPVDPEPTPVPPVEPTPVSPDAWKELVQPANSQTKIVSVSVKVAATNAFCLNVRLTGTTTTAAPWAVTVDTSSAPFYGRTGTLWSGESINFADRDKALWTVTGKGNQPTQWNGWNDSWNNAWTSSNGTYSFSVCESAMLAPPDRGDSYTTTVAPSPLGDEWGGMKNCMVVNVKGNGAYPFYSGWSRNIDMSAALADFKARGITTSYVSWSPNGSAGQTVTPVRSGLDAPSYIATGGRDNAVIGEQTTVFKMCLNGYR